MVGEETGRGSEEGKYRIYRELTEIMSDESLPVGFKQECARKYLEVYGLEKERAGLDRLASDCELNEEEEAREKYIAASRSINERVMDKLSRFVADWRKAQRKQGEQGRFFEVNGRKVK